MGFSTLQKKPIDVLDNFRLEVVVGMQKREALLHSPISLAAESMFGCYKCKDSLFTQYSANYTMYLAL
jgi:hypothetical protein